MTVTEPTQDAQAVEMVNLTIDDVGISVPKGTLVIRAAELMGIQIPRFCDHPLLDPVGACRQCLVEVEGQRKPMASCTITCTPDMVVRTQFTSESADKAQQGVMELLLINHPLDCPVCDKGGECPLQNQAMSNGRAETRFEDVKRTFPKPIPISAEVLLDRERCVLCARCTRFSQQIAGDPFIEMLERGALQQVGIAPDEPFSSYFSGNTVQICPVGALTNTAYRFRARPFDLVSSPSACEHCASGCAQRTDHRRGKVLRRLAGDDPEVNEEWNCDKGRWAFTYAGVGDRIATPQIREEDGKLRSASWSEALGVAAAGLAAAAGRAGVLVGGRCTVEDAYAYSKFARMVLGTNDIDFRIRPHSDEEAAFLAANVAGQTMTVTYADLEKAPAVLLAGFEPEEESPIVFLRLRKAARKNGVQVLAIAPFATRGLTKMSGTLIRTAPGGEAAALDGLTERDAAEPTRRDHSGRRAAGDVTGSALCGKQIGGDDRCPAGLGPAARRRSRRPGGRCAAEPAARRTARRRCAGARADRNRMAHHRRPAGAVGRDTAGILAAAAAGELGALLIGGVELADLPDPDAALGRDRRRALRRQPGAARKRGHRPRRRGVPGRARRSRRRAHSSTGRAGFGRSNRRCPATPPPICGCCTRSPTRSASTSACRMPRPQARNWPGWAGGAAPGLPRPTWLQREAAEPGKGEAVLAGWRMLLDSGRLQDGEPYLAGTARAPVARLSAATAAEIGVGEGDSVTVATSAR